MEKEKRNTAETVEAGKWIRVASGTKTLYRCSICRKNSFGGEICPYCKSKMIRNK